MIDADGRVSDCTAISFSGAAGPADDHCKVIYTMHFEAGGPAPMTGTIVVTAYLRRQTAT